MLTPESVDLLGPTPDAGGLRADRRTSLLKGLWTFGWPVVVPAGLFVLAVAIYACMVGGVLFAIGMFTLAFIIVTVLLLAILFWIYSRLRALEASDEPDNTMPDRAVLSATMALENDGDQNHLFGISVMKPGWLRGLTLRLAYWVIAQLAATQFRPGFLGGIGTIHFARWILLPGTDKLLFLSNYGGSWETIWRTSSPRPARPHRCLENTYGFPRTENLFLEGASDGDRFKRWARRQQRPTLFWYSAYPNNTTARIRIGAAIRQGLASASTEDEAADWLSLLGSRVRSADTVQSPQVQSLMFGGMGNLADATCLILRLPDNVAKARSWLAAIAPEISFGDQRPSEYARILSSCSGLQRLGLSQARHWRNSDRLQQGMSDARRPACPGRHSEDSPAHWWWGHGENQPTRRIIYAGAHGRPPKLHAEIDRQCARLREAGGDDPSHCPEVTLGRGRQSRRSALWMGFRSRSYAESRDG